MKSRMLFFGLILGICLPSAMAQDIDVTQLTADTKTFIFSNNKNTVKGYIYAALEKETSCCGSDRIYLEVRIDPSGYVTQAKTLTGKNDCFKQSAIDIVKNVKWNAKDFKREKSVYFEIKPDVDCDGAKENNYALIEVFNNELLDKEGNRVYAANAPAGNEPTSVSSAATNTKPVEVASTNISTPASTATKPAATSTPVVTPAAATAATTTAPTGAAAQPIASSEGATRSNTSTTPVASSEADFLKAKERVELERNVKDEEIRILKEQMDAARAREDAAREREKNLREEKARRDREREESKRQSESFASNDDGAEGGLFFDGGDEGSSSAPDQGGDGRFDQGGDPAASAEQRAREEISRLEQQKRELENKRRDRDNQLRNQEREDQLAAQEMLRIEQQILDKQEQMEQDRERRELDKLEQDRRRAEEEQRKYEEEVRRMMDEIGRLQAESERKMQELERQKEEMTRLAQLRIQREQEQVLQRQVRETEKQARLEQMRLAASGTSVRSVPIAGTSPTNFVIPQVDSASKLDLILMQLQVLQSELQRVQANMSVLSGGGSIPPTGGGTLRGTSQSPQRPVVPPTTRGAKNAATDKSWQKIDNGIDSGTRGGNGGAYTPPVDPSRFDAVRGYSPEVSHKESFVNTQVQRFPSPTSGQGQGNMKNYIKEELRKRGICGLAQSLAEVTIDPKGDVTRYNIIKANDIQVSGALPAILTGMKFEPSDLDVPYVSYIEFKAEILCEGQDRINIREVDDYLQGRP